MGLFDSVANAVLGKVTGGEQGGLAQMAMEMFNQKRWREWLSRKISGWRIR
jgi:hypothetical protein